MVAVVHLTRKLREVYGHKRHRLNTLLTHPFEETMLHVPATHVIVDQPHLYALPRLVDQGIGHQTAQGVVGDDIHVDMDVTLGLTDILQQHGEELIAVHTHIYLVVLKGQRQVLVHEEVYQGLVLLWQSEVLLFRKLQHRAFGQHVHRPVTHVALLTGVDAKEKVEHNTHERNKPYHQRPGHRLGRLTIVQNHVDDSHDDDHLIDTE